MTDEDAVQVIKNFMLKKTDLWIEGHTVSMFYDAQDDSFCVMRIDDESYKIEEKVFTDERIDEAVRLFLSWFDNDRISLTDEEANV